MGGMFSKKEKSRITEQDRAVLALKKQRDQLKQYQKRINLNLEKDREVAKRLLKEGKTDRAKLLLRKKKYQEGLLERTDNQLDQLERLVQDIEFAQVQTQVVEGLKKGNEALERANSIFSVEDIEELLDETQEAVERQREIDALLSGQLTQEDEDDVMAELDELMATEAAEVQLPSVPDVEPAAATAAATAGPEELELPDVPSGEVTSKVKAAKAKKERIAVAAS